MLPYGSMRDLRASPDDADVQGRRPDARAAHEAAAQLGTTAAHKQALLINSASTATIAI
jgi:hypothetical protein